MELASNLVWAAIAITLLALTFRGIRRGSVRLSALAALLLAFLVGLILLPAISISDDLIAAKQSALPLSAQTWRMASEDASVALEVLLAVTTFLFLLSFDTGDYHRPRNVWNMRPLAARLARSHRLRPPPCTA